VRGHFTQSRHAAQHRYDRAEYDAGSYPYGPYTFYQRWWVPLRHCIFWRAPPPMNYSDNNRCFDIGTHAGASGVLENSIVA